MLGWRTATTFSAASVVGLLLCGCFTITEFEDTDPGSNASTSTSSTGASFLPSTSMPPVDPSTSSSSSSSDLDSETGASTEDPECTGGFLDDDCRPDAPPIGTCNLWEDDCPRGEKCTIWANDGGSHWNTSRCVPLAPKPAGPGEACTAQESAYSGFDDCDLGSVCLVSDGLQGKCMPMCIGSPSAPACEDPNRTCTIGGDSIPAFCRPDCDPLDLESCAQGEGCYPAENHTVCAPDASGPDAGALFDPCEFVNACDPGLLCASATAVGACPRGVARCCTPWCDLEDPMCPEPTTCVPTNEPEPAPPGQENVGVCAQEATP